MAINYAALALSKAVINVCFCAHLFACLWGLQTVFWDAPGGAVPVYDAKGRSVGFVDTWKASGGYCVLGGFTEDDAADNWVCVAPFSIYMAALYWAIMTITSIGYGDVAATPLNGSEQAMAALMMLGGGFIWGNVIGTFCGVLATSDPHGAEFKASMDNLNLFMRRHDFSADFQRRLREYMHQTKHLQTAKSHRTLLTLMSPTLQGEVAWRSNERWLSRVWFLRGASPGFMVQMALSLRAMVFAPGEVANAGFLYVVHRGIALYGGRVLTSGKVWGEDLILMSEHLRVGWVARAMNYLEVYLINRDELLEVASLYPETYKAIRRAAIFLAMKRTIVRIAEIKKGEPLRTKSSFDRFLSDATNIDTSSDGGLAERLQKQSMAAETPVALVRQATSSVNLGEATESVGRIEEQLSNMTKLLNTVIATQAQQESKIDKLQERLKSTML